MRFSIILIMTEWSRQWGPTSRDVLCSNSSFCLSQPLTSVTSRQLCCVRPPPAAKLLFLFVLFFCFSFQLISFYPPESSDNRQNFCGWTDAARRLHLSHYRGSCVWSHETPPPPQTGPPPPPLLSSSSRDLEELQAAAGQLCGDKSSAVSDFHSISEDKFY